ncbi:MAG: hypothetical protein M1818_006674 [Claussenomyces sp. TS43310]|nr:MAG: hypothetical protein M1818_006894 [Claussenomyces sp. TS43310]KAI9735096.1 MAG: hypothetical protein M1818_006674 [Claussenomyces sp. TS43310]
MTTPQANDMELPEPLEQWTCFECFETISADRPPIFNSRNCSCAQAGSSLYDPGITAAAAVAAAEDLDLGKLSLEPKHWSTTPALTEHSYGTSPASSDLSLGPRPEHQVRRSRDAYWQTFIHSTGLGAPAHQRHPSIHTSSPPSSSPRTEEPYSLHRYLNTLAALERSYHGPYGDDDDDPVRPNPVPSYDALVSLPSGTLSIPANKKSSRRSSRRGTSMASSDHIDPLLGNGTWMDPTAAAAAAAGGWPLTIDDEMMMMDIDYV